jgi:hypothetical protein
MKPLPQKWWFFIPVWLLPLAFLGMIALAARFGIWCAFVAGIVYIHSFLLTLIPLRRNDLSTLALLAWVFGGMMLVGFPTVVVILLIFQQG